MYMILWCIYYTYINWYQSISSCIIYHDLHAYKFIAPFLGATWYRPGWCQLLRGCKHAGSLQNPHEHQHWSIHGLISNRSQPTTGRSRFDIFNQHRPEISLMFSHPNFLVVDAFEDLGHWICNFTTSQQKLSCDTSPPVWLSTLTKWAHIQNGVQRARWWIRIFQLGMVPRFSSKAFWYFKWNCCSDIVILAM